MYKLNNAKKIEHMPMAEQVTEKLMEWIMDGKLVMGQKLKTEEIAQELGVSRMPVREALRRMEKMGLVESVPYVGSNVINLTHEDVHQIYLMRAALEPITAYYACQNASEEEIKEVIEIHSYFSKMIDQGGIDAKGIFIMNQTFHMAIYRASGLDKICNTIENLWSNLAFYKLIYGRIYVGNPETSKGMIAEHQRYVDYLISKQADSFRDELKSNLEKTGQLVAEKVEQMVEEMHVIEEK